MILIGRLVGQGLANQQRSRRPTPGIRPPRAGQLAELVDVNHHLQAVLDLCQEQRLADALRMGRVLKHDYRKAA